MAAIAGDFGLFRSRLLAKLAAIFFASRRYANAGLMAALVGLRIAHCQTPSESYVSGYRISLKSGERFKSLCGF